MGNDIMIVGEAWGEEEAKQGLPFVGTSGFILDGMLKIAGIPRKECYLTNVFNLRPKANDVKSLCGTKAEGIPGMPVLTKGKYVRREYAPELDRLYKEIRHHNPNVIVALGATSSWALLHSSGIKAVRGAIAPTAGSLEPVLGRTFKVLPTYHPSAVARDWTLRPIVITDLDKALRQSMFPEIRRPRREVWIKPTLDDLAEFHERYIKNAFRLSIDIETKGDQITCIGFAPSPDVAMVIPFYAVGYPGCNYWPSLDQELVAWEYVRRWCQYPALFQNGMYDIHFLWRRYGIPVPNAEEDTMLLHHAYQIEMEKGLGFLGTVYTDESSWKHMSKIGGLKKGE